MNRCHSCGRNVPSGSSVFRVVKTGTYSEGGDYMREVILCPQCNQKQSQTERLDSTKKWVFLAAAAAAMIGLALYWLSRR